MLYSFERCFDEGPERYWAIYDFSMAIQLAPDDCSNYAGRGTLFHLKKQFDRALKATAKPSYASLMIQITIVISPGRWKRAPMPEFATATGP